MREKHLLQAFSLVTIGYPWEHMAFLALIHCKTWLKLLEFDSMLTILYWQTQAINCENVFCVVCLVKLDILGHYSCALYVPNQLDTTFPLQSVPTDNLENSKRCFQMHVKEWFSCDNKILTGHLLSHTPIYLQVSQLISLKSNWTLGLFHCSFFILTVWYMWQSEMEKRADTADISVLFLFGCAILFGYIRAN